MADSGIGASHWLPNHSPETFFFQLRPEMTRPPESSHKTSAASKTDFVSGMATA